MDRSKPLFDPAGFIPGFTNGQLLPLARTYLNVYISSKPLQMMLELWVDLGGRMGDNSWQKVAYCASAPMVVRGWAPDHSHLEGFCSNASREASGANGNMQYGPGANRSLMGRQERIWAVRAQ